MNCMIEGTKMAAHTYWTPPGLPCYLQVYY